MVQETDNHNLNKYEHGDDNWTHSTDMDHLERRVPVRDVESNLGDYTPHSGAQFVATDTGAVYDGDGASWNAATREVESVATDSATINSATIDDTQIAIGDSTTDATTGDASQGVAIGKGAKATANDTVAVGEGASAVQDDAVMVGRGAQQVGTGVRPTAIGDDPRAPGRGVSLGTLAGNQSGADVSISSDPRSGDIAIGESAGAAGNGDGAIAIGRQAAADQLGTHTWANIAIGRSSQADYDGTIAIGQNTFGGADGAIAIGHGVTVGTAGLARIGGQTDALSYPAVAGTVANADMNNSEVVAEIDETNSNLVFKVKNSAGTVKTGTVSIT